MRVRIPPSAQFIHIEYAQIMGRRVIHQCDGCGKTVEESQQDLVGDLADLTTLVQERETRGWGILSRPGLMVNTSFDLCATCLQKAAAAVGLQIPEQRTITHSLFGTSPIRRQQTPHMQVFNGGLTPEELKALGLKESKFYGSPSHFICSVCGWSQPLTETDPAVCGNCGHPASHQA